MSTNNKKEKGSKQQVQTRSATNAGIDPDNSSKPQTSNDTDTAPDQFIGTDADTDRPIDGQVVNDAVLRGEKNPEKKRLIGQPGIATKKMNPAR